jgi:hypothetical protein
MKSPKSLLLTNADVVRWWQGVVDDPRFQFVSSIAELQVIRHLPDSVNPNVMMANDAARVGVKRALTTLAEIANANAKPNEWELPAVLHNPDKPLPPRS